MKNPGTKVNVCETNKLPLHNFIPDITSLSPRLELVVGRGDLAKLIVTISRGARVQLLEEVLMMFRLDAVVEYIITGPPGTLAPL